jgi:hypothetical protein
MSKREFAVSVPLDRSQREFVERLAALEDRTLASVVRRCVEAVQRAQEVAMSGPTTMQLHQADVTAAEAVRQTALAQPG